MIANRGKLAAATGLAVVALLVAPGRSNGQTDQAESMFGDAGAEAANLSVFSRITGRVAGEAVPAGASAEACAAAFERALLAVKAEEEAVTRRGNRVAYPLTVELQRRGSGCRLIVAPPPTAAVLRSELLTTSVAEGCVGCLTVTVATFTVPAGCTYVSHRTRVADARPAKSSEADSDAMPGWSYAVRADRDLDGRVRRITRRLLAEPRSAADPEVRLTLEVLVSMSCREA